jgi:Uncharacterized protein conserved in bacteria (DUF2188)
MPLLRDKVGTTFTYPLNYKTMGKNQHVVPHGKEWAIKGEGNSKYTLITDTQSEAIQIARDIAQNQKNELFIHNRQGQIRERNSYGNDTYPPQG